MDIKIIASPSVRIIAPVCKLLFHENYSVMEIPYYDMFKQSKCSGNSSLSVFAKQTITDTKGFLPPTAKAIKLSY